jgi:hypothetical protein
MPKYYFRILSRQFLGGELFYVQRNKFWKWVNLNAYGYPAKYPKLYKNFDDAYDALVYFKTVKEKDLVIYEDPSIPKF